MVNAELFAAEGGGSQICTSWHRYTSFRALHERIASDLGLPPKFAVPNWRLFTDDHKHGRAPRRDATAAPAPRLVPPRTAALPRRLSSSTARGA